MKSDRVEFLWSPAGYVSNFENNHSTNISSSFSSSQLSFLFPANCYMVVLGWKSWSHNRLDDCEIVLHFFPPYLYWSLCPEMFSISPPRIHGESEIARRLLTDSPHPIPVSSSSFFSIAFQKVPLIAVQVMVWLVVAWNSPLLCPTGQISHWGQWLELDTLSYSWSRTLLQLHLIVKPQVPNTLKFKRPALFTFTILNSLQIQKLWWVSMIYEW